MDTAGTTPETPVRRASLIERLLHLNFADRDDRNTWYLCLEIFGAVILGSAASFNAAFAVHMEASNFVVGLLTSLPALLVVLVSIPAGRFLESRAKRKGWILGALAIHRTGYALVALIPWLKFLGMPLGTLAVFWFVVITAPAHFFNVGWIPLLADVIPERRRAAVFAARNVIASSTTALFVFLFGQWLDWMPFPGNYQIMYLVGYAGSLLSLYYLFKLQVPDSTPVVQPQVLQSLRGQWQGLQDSIKEQPQFWKITRNTLLYGIGLWTASPLYVLYFVRQLGATDGWLGLNGMIASLATIFAYILWRWVISRKGEPKVLRGTIVGPGWYPLLVGLVPSLPFILLAGAFNGIVSGGVNLSHFNVFLLVCPEDRRPSFYALYATIMNIGAFVCPLIGVALANQFGLAPTLVGCGIFAVLGATSFWLWPVKPVQPALAVD